MEETITYSLADFCRLAQQELLQALPGSYWVTAEISRISMSGGHCYLNLVEKSTDPRKEFAAKVPAHIWKNQYQNLAPYFEQTTGQSLSNGMQIKIKVCPELHPEYGFSLQVIDIDPNYTLGDLARQRQETLARLQADGIMEMNKELELPTLIQRIAVISSQGAAGYGDFEDQMKRNATLFAYSATLFEAIVQGSRASASILDALQKVMEREQEFDVVVIIRGGGATTDLQCFDDYALAAACAQFPLPVLTGIGHTRDISVLDMVAHTSLKTPTAVATFIIEHNNEQVVKLADLKQRLSVCMTNWQGLQQQNLVFLRQQLQQALVQTLRRKKDELDLLEKQIKLYSPATLFQKGYTLTRINGQLVTSSKQVKAGDQLVTIFADGTVHSQVQEDNEK